MKQRVNGIVLSNDGEKAVLRMPNGKLMTVNRTDPLVDDVQTVAQFLKDFIPGEVSPSFEKLYAH